MKFFRTAQIAALTGIHPNTVRFYEEVGFITKPHRAANGYRLFTQLHVEQIRFARLALRAEITQNGLRKQAVSIVEATALQEYDRAVLLTEAYLNHIQTEQEHAQEAILIAEGILHDCAEEIPCRLLTRKQTAQLLGVTADTLRNWEMNGLLTVKRKQNGYRVYTQKDIKILKIIRSLRCAGYSLAAILRMLNAIKSFPDVNLKQIIDTPQKHEDVVSVCDRLLTSLKNVERDALEMKSRLIKIKKITK